MRSFPNRALGLAAILLVSSPAKSVAADPPPLEIGVIGGLLDADAAIAGSGPAAGGPGAPVGLQVVRRIRGGWAAFADGHWAGVGSPLPSGDAWLVSLRAGVRAFTPPLGDHVRFFTDAGAGFLRVHADYAAVARPFVSAGVGQRFLLSGAVALHWEARVDAVRGDAGADFLERSSVNRQLLAGVSIPVGGGPPRDADGDGVPDGRDACANTPAGARVDANGCPLDGDRDGVWDGLDECPQTPIGLRVDRRGCSDADGDGVADDRDDCADTPAGWPVDGRGCPLDSDRDGVADGVDLCPGTARGAVVDADGCPKAAPLFVPGEDGRLKAVVLEGVSFANDSALLTPESRAVLDGVAASLIAWPDVRVEVGVHTGSRGDDAHDERLSQRRADAVRTYLTARGVDPARLTAKGYGGTEPVAGGDTPGARARNRRVELRPAG